MILSNQNGASGRLNSREHRALSGSAGPTADGFGVGMDREAPLDYASHAPVIAGARDQHRSLEDVHSSVAISRGHWWKRLLSFSGPAFMVSVGYMDPGNWATDLAAGARFGYRLIWVI